MTQIPRRKMDWVGRYVRLLRPASTRGGNMFPAGMVMEVRRNYGGLELQYAEACPHCALSYRHHIRGISERDVELLAVSYKPAGWNQRPAQVSAEEHLNTLQAQQAAHSIELETLRRERDELRAMLAESDRLDVELEACLNCWGHDHLDGLCSAHGQERAALAESRRRLLSVEGA